MQNKEAYPTETETADYKLPKKWLIIQVAIGVLLFAIVYIILHTCGYVLRYIDPDEYVFHQIGYTLPFIGGSTFVIKKAMRWGRKLNAFFIYSVLLFGYSVYKAITT